MAGDHLALQKQYRIEALVLEDKQERADRIIESEKYSPIFKASYKHQEEEPNMTEINEDTKDILSDLFIIDGELSSLAIEYEKLLTESSERINNASKAIEKAKEKIMDLNMICPQGSDFFHVISLTNDHFTEEVFESNVITAKKSEGKTVNSHVVDITGNGMEGNDYVYNNKAFASEKMFTGKRDFMTDSSVITIYEYQKINCDKSEPYQFPDMSFDKTEARCVITIEAEEPISSIKLISSDKTISIEEVHVSENNDDYENVLEQKIFINQKESMYQDSQYIYEGGIVAFPLSRFIKITVSSNGYTSDSIAFVHSHL